MWMNSMMEMPPHLCAPSQGCTALLGEKTRSSGVKGLLSVVVLPKHLVSSSSWPDSGHTDVGVQGKQPQNKKHLGAGNP